MAVHEAPPLQVAITVGREVLQCRVHIPYIEASGMRRAHLEPAGVPEYRGEHLADALAVADIAVGGYQHPSSGCEHFFRPLIEGLADIDVCFRHNGVVLRRIYPEIPVVAAADLLPVCSANSGEADAEGVFARLIGR